MSDFKGYSKQVEQATNSIHLKEAIATGRKGVASTRDRIVFGKFSWQEALSFLAIVQSGYIFMGLTDDVVINVNGAFEWLGIPYQFPVALAGLMALVVIGGMFIFGLVAVRYIGTIRRSNEISTKMNPGMFLLWERQKKIMKKLGIDNA